jgi:hypothetical protein
MTSIHRIFKEIPEIEVKTLRSLYKIQAEWDF